MRDVEILQKAVEDAVAAENCFPGVATHQIADPERNDDQLVEKFFARACVERQEIRQRISEKYRKKCNSGGDACGAKEDLDVEWIPEQREVVVEIPMIEDDAVSDSPEAVQKHEQVRKKKKERHPENRREGDEEFVSAGIHFSDQGSATGDQF